MAAVSGVQGYIKTLNLAESDQDRQAINNLGVAPIADDISLFINNTRNESQLLVKADEFNSLTGQIKIVNTTIEDANLRSAVFTNKDRVVLRNLNNQNLTSDLFVINSNGIDTLSLSTDADSDVAFIFFPTEDFYIVRNDVVQAEDLINLGRQQSGTSVSTSPGDLGTEDVASGGDDDKTFNELFNELYGYLDIANYKSDTKYTREKDIATNEAIRTEGGIIVNDPSDTITTEGIVASSPGIYISNPESSLDDIQRVRAFSSTQNPWRDDLAGTLSTDSVNVTTGTLVLNGGLTVNGITVNSQSGTVNNSTFTHKIKVQIDGIDYFLCLSS